MHSEILRGDLEFTIINLSAIGALSKVLPEIDIMRNFEQRVDRHPEGNALNHIINCLARLNWDDSDLIKICVLLHDVGKPVAFKDGHFHGHDEMGVPIAIDIAKRLGFTEPELEVIAWCVRHHMKLHRFDEMKDKKKRMLCEHPCIGHLMIVHEADCFNSPRPCNNDSVLAWMESKKINNDSINIYKEWRAK
ncbi:HD domain-containing protein [Bacteroides sp.]|uniref:HD domain-containing protein n=1 Tax=Bacteroides sp. TaxID=29523 RepID=UPI0026317F0F|nr:HD domain-containing protein [Bacteroides sp.]MDD3040551.1 HD domain-containing protein [Bacteroides sp.]